MSFTYATLKTAIQDYTQNTETTFVSHLDDFIKNAEERILKNIQLSYFRKNVSGSMTSSNRFLSAPSDFLAPYSLSVTSSSEHVFLEFKDPDFIQTFNPNSATTGTPKFFRLGSLIFLFVSLLCFKHYMRDLNFTKSISLVI